MKLKAFSILILGSLPAVALAAGDPAGGHGMEAQQMMQGHDMSTMQKAGPASMAGKPGDPVKVSRTIEITMNDAKQFTPDKISVKAGETVRLFVKNAGKTPHAMAIGTPDELKEHAEMMRKMPGMQHDGPNMVTLKAGQRGGIVWQFDKPGTADFACLVPGHMEAGMTGRFFIEPLAKNGN